MAVRLLQYAIVPATGADEITGLAPELPRLFGIQRHVLMISDDQEPSSADGAAHIRIGVGGHVSLPKVPDRTGSLRIYN